MTRNTRTKSLLNITFHIALTVHLLSAIGCFGILIAASWGLPSDRRKDADIAIPLLRRATSLLTLGLITGLVVYFLRIRIVGESGNELVRFLHAVVGAKFLILIAVGGCLGMGLSRARRGAAATALTGTALALLAVGTFLGVVL